KDIDGRRETEAAAASLADGAGQVDQVGAVGGVDVQPAGVSGGAGDLGAGLHLGRGVVGEHQHGEGAAHAEVAGAAAVGGQGHLEVARFGGDGQPGGREGVARSGAGRGEVDGDRNNGVGVGQGRGQPQLRRLGVIDDGVVNVPALKTAD